MATEVLGPEYDRRVARATRSALRKIGARRVDQKWSLGGSQEIVCQRWMTSAGALSLTAETYVGVVLEGPDEIVAQIAEIVKLRLGRAKPSALYWTSIAVLVVVACGLGWAAWDSFGWRYGITVVCAMDLTRCP